LQKNACQRDGDAPVSDEATDPTPPEGESLTAQQHDLLLDLFAQRRPAQDQLDELRVQWNFDLTWPAFFPAYF